MRRVSEFPSKRILLFYFLCQFFLSISFGYKVKDKFDAFKYLARFGYIEPNTVDDMSLVEAKPYLSEFQKMMGLDQTGELDRDTMKMMNSPRCGNTDLNEPMNSDSGEIRVKRYAFLGSEWRKRLLTYKITKYSDSMTVDLKLVEADIEKAFGLWEAATNLRFKKASPGEHIDIEIEFATKNHSDSFPFDGPGTTLAHAFRPSSSPIGGDVHFDDHEKWTTDSPYGINVLYVAVHELGHSLGLGHSKVQGSIMAPSYQGYRPNLKLHPDDIQGIRTLYGARDTDPPKTTTTTTPATTTTRKKMTTTTTERISVDRLPPTPEPTTEKPPVTDQSFHSRSGKRTTTTTPKPTTEPSTTIRTKRPLHRSDLCIDPKIDAAFTTGNEIHLLKGNYMYTINGLISSRHGSLGRPRRIESIYPEMDPPLDACFTRMTTGFTYCFKGNKYWRMAGTQMSSGYPREMTLNFPGIPSGIDAAFEWPQNGRFYFFKGDKYWVFDPRAKDSFVHPRYPQSIENLGLNVNSIDAAFVHPVNERVYLFKGGMYWRLQDEKPKVSRAEPPYPRESRLMWFRCTSYTPEINEI